MDYARLNGDGPAFGWRRERRVTLGGLRPAGEYRLICEEGEYPATADDRGNWTGQLLRDPLLCVAQGSRVILWDESRVDATAAAALLAARDQPPAPPRASERPAEKREEPAPEKPEEAEPEIMPDPAPVSYRPPSEGQPVDALPELVWPQAAAQLRPYMENNRPAAVFAEEGWRTVRVREAGMPCCFGIRVRDDRVCGALYAVGARGGMIPPRGLTGYRYERALDGTGYWVLRQEL